MSVTHLYKDLVSLCKFDFLIIEIVEFSLVLLSTAITVIKLNRSLCTWNYIIIISIISVMSIKFGFYMYINFSQWGKDYCQTKVIKMDTDPELDEDEFN